MQIDVASILALGLLLALVFLAWRGGGQSPDVERALVAELGKVKNRMSKVESELGVCASKTDIAALSGKIEALEEYAASSGDMNALEGKVNVIAERVANTKEIALQTHESVKVIERLLMKGRLDQ